MRSAKPILCSGEILFDFISREPMKGLEGTTLFEKKPGGAPFNIAAGLQRLSVPTAFLAKIGCDEFGNALLDFLKGLGISTDYIIREPGTKTPIAFAALDAEGKPEFRFYWDHAAHISLKKSEIESLPLENFSLFHFGSIVLLEEPSASTYVELFDRFKAIGTRTTFDPNIRKSVVKDHETYRALLMRIMGEVDILKLSDEDLVYIADCSDLDRAIEKLSVRPEALVFITLGGKGSMVLHHGRIIKKEGFKVKVAETTGCGDSFMAAIISKLYNLSREEIESLSRETLEDILDFANAEAAIVATRFGAANAMPSKDEVEEFLKNRG